MKTSILLGSGSIFNYLEPDGCDISIEDIAYGLAFSSRFAGQCRRIGDGCRVFYSVAEHCVRMSYAVPEKYAYDALMHESGESVCGDIPGPLKRICPDYSALEKSCSRSIMDRFLVEFSNPALIKTYDYIMFATEWRDLMAWSGIDWELPEQVSALAETIIPWGAHEAAEKFLARYYELRPML